MAQIAKHPKYDHAVSRLKRRFEDSIDADQQSAIAQLNQTQTALVTLVVNRSVPLGSEIIAEVADLTKVIESVDARCIDDDAIALLQLVEMRLSRIAKLMKTW